MIRQPIRVLIFLLLLISFGPYHTARAQQREILPKAIAGIPFKGAKEFEDPRLGLGVTYQEGGTSLTLFIYNAGQKEIPPGVDGSLVRAQFEQSKSDIQEAVRQKIFDKAVLEREGIAQLGSQDPKVPAREAVFDVKMGNEELKSYLYMTSVNNFLFKVRYTVPQSWRAAQRTRSGGDLTGSGRSDLFLAEAKAMTWTPGFTRSAFLLGLLFSLPSSS